MKCTHSQDSSGRKVHLISWFFDALALAERDFQAADYRLFPGLGFAHQPPSVYRHQVVQPVAFRLIELGFAIAGEQEAQFLLSG